MAFPNWADDALPSLVDLFDPPSHNLCDFGDIVLVIEDGYHPQLKMKVNSCILASTSKVFRTLFRGCFAEGEAIRSGTREIYMNDKPAPMLALCQLLHLKPIEPIISGPKDVLEFALLVDKFDCVQALQSATDGLLGCFAEKDGYHDLAVSSYILDQPRHFRRFTKAIVRESTDHLLPELDVQHQSRTIEHLPDSFMSSIIHQQNSVRNELVRCLTGILDQFTTAAYREHKPNLVHQFMTTMKAQKLWPIWPSSELGTLESLGDQIASFSALEIPTINADRDAPYEPAFSPNNRPGSMVLREQYLNDGWGPAGPSPIPSFRAYEMPDSQIPTLRTVLEFSKRVDELCVGLCLDCLKGNEVCRLPHPNPWMAYRESFRLWFEPRAPHVPRTPSRDLETESEMSVWEHAMIPPRGGW